MIVCSFLQVNSIGHKLDMDTVAKYAMWRECKSCESFNYDILGRELGFFWGGGQVDWKIATKNINLKFVNEFLFKFFL